MTSLPTQYHQCKICKVPVVPSVWAQHIKGKKHVSFSPKKIVVKGDFDKEKVKEVHEYFAKFGVITSENVKTEEGKVLVEYTFEEVAAYTEIVQTEHKLFNQKLEICWERGKAVVPQTAAANNSKQVPAKGAPNAAKSVTEQVALVAGSSAGVTKTAAQDNRPSTIQKMAAAESATYKLQILASVKEGATFADQMAILENKLKVDQAQVENNRRLIRNDLTAALSPMFALNKIYFFGSSITGLDVPGSDLDVYIANVRQQFKSEVMMLKLIRTLIFKCRKFCDVLLISGAKIPIIKCIHTKTQICCDLNIRNKLSVCNSELIKYYLSLDEKLKPLMIMIKFWAERCGLKKVNYFSSYALYMMVIFYLQQEPYSLPSVLELQRPTPPDIVDGWNGSFAPLDFESEALTHASMLDLVAGFFKFYSKFDYAGYVVAPYVGKGIEKTGFLKPFDLPGYYHAYSSQHQVFQVNVSICIQDPFEHSRNVSASVPHNCVGKFVVLCKHAAQMTTQSEKGLLYKLLMNMSSPLNEYAFLMKKDEERDEKEWIQSIKSTTSKLLKEVLHYDVTEMPSFGADHISYTCVGKWNVWENRVNIMKNLQSELPHDVSEIDKEIAVTTCIVKYFPKALQTWLVVNLTFKKNPCRMEFLAKSKTKCKVFLHVSHFIRVKLEECMEKGAVEVDDVANEAETEKMAEGEIQPVTEPAEVEENAPNTTVSEVSQVDNMIKTVEEIKSDEKNCDEKESSKQTESKDVGNDFDSVEKIQNKVSHDVKTSESVTNDVGEKSKTQEEGEIADEEEEEEEDVPADFFDDFSNQDFMDGLDIVDAWDEDTKVAETEAVVAEDSDKKSHSPIRFVSKDSRKSSEKRLKKQAKSRSRSPLRRHKRSDSHGRKRSKSKSRDKMRADVRRDPEKTRRDITRDKVKCAKDKEQKLVSDKLKIVETGLVPPGTEMEADLGTLLRDSKPQPTSPAEKPREARPAERRYSRRSGSREVRKTARYSRSPPIYRVRNREREPAYRVRRRTGSIDSNVSERELWIRSSRKRTRSRSRESQRTKQRKYEEEKKKKKTFLEEIRDKLNEVRPPVPQAPVQVMYGYSNGPQHQMPAPAPVPAPAPNQFFQVGNNPALQQYDQSFFIGEGYQNVMIPHPQVDFNMMGSAGNVVQQVPVGQVAPMQPAPTAVNLPPVPQQKALVSPKVSSDSVAKANEQKDNHMTDDIDKLFADKKISLSDFLTITAKCEVQSSSPEHLQKKIKVISRCQDAIKAMSEDRKFSGRLLVKPSTEGKNKSEVKYQSPLRRIPIVRFQFTSPAKACEEVDSFATVLDKILQKIGVLQEIVDLNESTESVAKVLANSAFSDEETAALTLKACLLNSKKPTDGVGCEECKKRKAIKHAEVGSQCAKETNSIGVQVNEEDLNPSRTPSKNESIAYLTPAQLLGKDKDKEAEKEKETAEVSEKMGEKMKVETKMSPSDRKKEKPKTPASRGGRGGFRKTLKDKPPYNFDMTGYEFLERRRPLLEDPRDFRNRYGGPVRFPRPFPDEVPPHILHLHQFREDANFTDFAQPLRGRNPKFGPRF